MGKTNKKHLKIQLRGTKNSITPDNDTPTVVPELR